MRYSIDILIERVNFAKEAITAEKENIKKPIRIIMTDIRWC